MRVSLTTYIGSGEANNAEMASRDGVCSNFTCQQLGAAYSQYGKTIHHVAFNTLKAPSGERSLVNITSQSSSNKRENDMKKRIIICLDGTWNEPSQCTNIHWIYNNIDTNNAAAIPQIREYVIGIGAADKDEEAVTGGSLEEMFKSITEAYNSSTKESSIVEELKERASDIAEKIFGGPLGVGLDRQIAEGHQFVQNEWKPGDELFIFGFSRGAEAARALALKLGSKVEIEFLGVFDTVAALGLPGVELIDDMYDISIGTHIKNVYHAVSIDENLRPFKLRPLVPIDADKTKVIDANKTNAEEVWFAGGHGDVGGGHPDALSGPSLAKVPLLWMMQRAEEVGLKLLSGSMDRLEKDADPFAPQHVTPPNVPETPSSGPHRKARIIPERSIVHDSVSKRLDTGKKVEIRNSKGDRVGEKRYQPANLPSSPRE